MGKDGSQWKHGYIPENGAAIALKAHKSPGGKSGGGGKTAKDDQAKDDQAPGSDQGRDGPARRHAQDSAGTGQADSQGQGVTQQDREAEGQAAQDEVSET
jgi:hypothetical protein